MKDLEQTILSQYANSPRLLNLIELFNDYLDPSDDIDTFYRDIWNLQTAQGYGLDIWGAIVGVSRDVRVPITGVYFSWSGSNPLDTGWGYGVWKRSYEPSTGIQQLDDYTFRNLIFARIRFNQWDGSIPGIYEILETAFPDTKATIIVQDNYDMSMIVGISDAILPGLHKAIVSQNFLPVRPTGVQLSGYRFVTENAPLFAWGSISFFDPPADAAFVDDSDWELADGESLEFVTRTTDGDSTSVNPARVSSGSEFYTSDGSLFAFKTKTRQSEGWGNGVWGEIHYGA